MKKKEKNFKKIILKSCVLQENIQGLILKKLKSGIGKEEKKENVNVNGKTTVRAFLKALFYYKKRKN